MLKPHEVVKWKVKRVFAVLKKKKPPHSCEECGGHKNHRRGNSAGAARRAARARSHSREHEALPLMEIDVRVHQHIVCSFLQKNFQTIQLEGRVAPQGRFGYVHSQRGASAAGDHEDSHPVSGSSLFFHYFLELCYCAVRQTDHYFLLA